MIMTNVNEPQATEVQAIEVPFEVPAGHRLLSDAEMQALAAQLVEDHREQWDIEQMIDSAAVAGEVNEMMRTELFYEFKQGGKPVRGLTAKMIGHLATERGISEVIEAREYVEHEDKHEFTVVVEMVNPLYPERMIRRSGFAEEPKELNGRYDKFAKQKAYTKAFRRACEKLIPRDLIIATTYKLARIVPLGWTPNQPQQKALSPAQNDNGQAKKQTPIEKAMQACFDVFGEKEADLLAKGAAKKDFWDALKQVLFVKSRDDMSLVQWKQVTAALEANPYGKIVQDVIAKIKDGKAKESTEETSTENSEKGASPSSEGD